jgi:hypothetical protein
VVVGHVRLGDQRLEAVVGELVLAEGAGEEATLVLASLHVEDEGTLELGLGEDHRFLRGCFRAWPPARQYAPRPSTTAENVFDRM